MAVPATPPPPLGLPPGSVRALLTLMIVGVVCVQLARGETLDLVWTETLAIALAHYFTTRRFVDLPPELVKRLKSEGVIPDEPKPLYLPGMTVRGLIILAFLCLALYLERQGRLLQESQPTSILGLVGIYLLGVVIQTVRDKLPASASATHRDGWRPAWNNLKAFVTLMVMTTTLAAYVLDLTDVLPVFWREATLGLALFYFGSR